ncbi:hypothetical protein MKW98_012773 [Papaver atlanticum]|uniref:F-box associated beta-propeller type 3 domain-containing protein n=1 Tax=Papaver atlanticum TaxID=357466 RepID=A0AAD4SNQ2_9MAGN|nr:hypothetical protein MKW98_012773 [Papaver atlanticum]
MRRNYLSSHRRYSDDSDDDDDELHYQGSDYLCSRFSMRGKRKSSSSTDYPIRRRPTEERTSRYHSPNLYRSKRRRRYDTPPIRYPSTPSPERRRRYDLHASRLSPERREDWDEDDVRLYNVSTREASPWIKSTLLSEERDKSEKKFTSILRKVIYRFGFDPEKEEHKVFCFCRLSDRTKPSRIAERPDYTSCEVLAVGRDTKWRRINVVPNENNQIKINKVFPSFDTQRHSVYGNGSIYWRTEDCSRKKKGLDVGSDDPDVIVALDVGSEEFRVIPIPKFVLDEDHVYNGNIAQIMLRGRVTVIITLPYCHYPRYVEFHGVADQLLLSVYSEDQSLYRKFNFLHFYDSRKKTFKKIEIDGLSGVPFFRGTSIITTFTGSLYPVQPQQDKTQQEN